MREDDALTNLRISEDSVQAQRKRINQKRAERWGKTANTTALSWQDQEDTPNSHEAPFTLEKHNTSCILLRSIEHQN